MKFYTHLILAIIALILISACSDDDDTSGISATNGDGVAELTGVPSFSPDPVSIDSIVTVSVPVDSDTTHVSIDVGVYNSATSTLNIYGSSARATSVTAGATNGIGVTVSSSLGAVAGTYVASVVTCSDGSCLLGSTGRWYLAGATYTVLNLVDLTVISSGITAPTFTVQ